jgi:hypothetical protein
LRFFLPEKLKLKPQHMAVLEKYELLCAEETRPVYSPVVVMGGHTGTGVWIRPQWIGREFSEKQDETNEQNKEVSASSKGCFDERAQWGGRAHDLMQ